MRMEHDLLGEAQIPDDAYYGVQTLRGLENFSITGRRLSDYPNFIKGLAITKEAAAEANFKLGYLSSEVHKGIVDACHEIRDGKFDKEFVVDMIQGGAGTSTNMNANEVIANICNEKLGGAKGEYKPCHPNNHVNYAQSTNDAYPTAAKIGLCMSCDALIEELKRLVDSIRAKSKEFSSYIKMGRTQLQDAVPMTLEQEFASYADSLLAEVDMLRTAKANLCVVNMGATAIGTGINCDPDYPNEVASVLSRITGYDITIAKNLITATNDTSDFLSLSSSLKRLSVKLSKICNDLRLLSSGPRTGFYEIKLPAVQPGSSIMPGKVNPVIPEVVNQVCFRVIGNDTTCMMAGEAAQLELNVFEPVMIYSLFEGISLLINAFITLRERCIKGIEANAQRCKDLVYGSIGLVTALNPIIGYEKSSDIAKTALRENRGVYDIALEKGYLSKEELQEALKPENMTMPKKMKK